MKDQEGAIPERVQPTAEPAPAAAPAAQPAAQPAAKPTSGIEMINQDISNGRDGYSGRGWQQLKGDYMRAIAKIGDPQAFVTLKDGFYDLEKRKISTHLKSAVALSQVGNQIGAAQQLQAAGFYMNPGVKGKVVPGPEGSFVVQNTGEDGTPFGGYALKPEQIMEIALAYEDTAAFGTYMINKNESAARIAQDWEKVAKYTRESEKRMSLYDQQIQKEMIEAQAAALDMQFDIDTYGARVGKADAEGRKAIAEATTAELAVEDALDSRGKAARERANSIVDGVLGDITEKQKADAEAAGKLPLGAEQEAVPTEAPSIFSDNNPDGSPDLNLVQQQLMSQLALAFVQANPNLTDNEIKVAVLGMTRSLNSEIEFSAGSNQTPGRAAARPGVWVNGTFYDLPPSDVAYFQAAIIGGRSQVLQANGLPVEQFVTRSGRRYSPRDYLKTQREGAVPPPEGGAIPEPVMGPPAPPPPPGPGGTTVDPNASPAMQDVQQFNRNNAINKELVAISTKLSVGGAGSPLGQMAGAVKDYFTASPSEGQSNAANRTANGAAADWYASEDAQEFFGKNPAALEMAKKDPVEFYRMAIGNRARLEAGPQGPQQPGPDPVNAAMSEADRNIRIVQNIRKAGRDVTTDESARPALEVLKKMYNDSTTDPRVKAHIRRALTGS